MSISMGENLDPGLPRWKVPVLSVVLEAHLPFIRHGGGRGLEVSDDPAGANTGGVINGKAADTALSAGEIWFFEALSETYIPLLQVMDRLEGDHVPFRLGISFSPILCHLLEDELLLQKYLEYTDKQIEFGKNELDRTSGDPKLQKLAEMYYERAVERRIAFTERYGGNILKVFDHYQRKGKIEILAASATHAFLPFYTSFPEAIQAQVEVGISSYRNHFGKYPQGFALPELGWTAELDRILRSYNFGYTITETHSLVFGNPPATKGSFYPVRTPSAFFVIPREHYAEGDISALMRSPVYRDNNEDAGYELPPELVQAFLGANGVRRPTGCKYRCTGSNPAHPGDPLAGEKELYDPQRAAAQAAEDARRFLDDRIRRLISASQYMEEPPLCLCALDADSLGRYWYEGPQFLEALFREGASRREIQFMNPVEYLYKQDSAAFETVIPEYSSSGINGYAEMWLDASNDWMYRHAIRAMDRMIELAERFPDDTGLKERSLNQAAREILLVQTSDWPKMLYKQENADFARAQIEDALRNFTTIYEALGSNYISTEWLTNLERRHNIFPHINYRVFRRKK
ncbi:glycoside hydrolase family protein [Spirochaetia bacterium]|nr:glycoside hydrolase family protein [Spirochaetia bacterium]